MSDLSRSILDALLPPGSIWTPKTGGDLDKLFDGIAANADEMVEFLGNLANIRNPWKTTMLPDMEAEYGIRTSTNKTEAERRAGLAAAISDTVSDGSLDTLQAKLDQAGFTVSVYANNPPVDPVLFVTEAYKTVSGNEDSLFGRSNAVFEGGLAGTLLVNGDLYPGESAFTIPTDTGYWPLFFFVGGQAVRNGSTNALEVIYPAPVTVARRDEIKRLILKYKPLHAWCGLIVEFV